MSIRHHRTMNGNLDANVIHHSHLKASRHVVALAGCTGAAGPKPRATAATSRQPGEPGRWVFKTPHCCVRLSSGPLPHQHGDKQAGTPSCWMRPDHSPRSGIVQQPANHPRLSLGDGGCAGTLFPTSYICCCSLSPSMSSNGTNTT